MIEPVYGIFKFFCLYIEKIPIVTVRSRIKQLVGSVRIY